MIITLPFKTPTINHLYWHRGNMKIMKKEAKELREKIKEIVNKEILRAGRRVGTLGSRMFLGMCKLAVVIEIHENWLTQKGEIAIKDIANREKFLIDSVFKALGVDDKYIYITTSKKVQNDKEEKAIIKIYEYQD